MVFMELMVSMGRMVETESPEQSVHPDPQGLMGMLNCFAGFLLNFARECLLTGCMHLGPPGQNVMNGSPGPQGPPGIPGAQGVQGSQGPQGPTSLNC
jgi:hypothetical protein